MRKSRTVAMVNMEVMILKALIAMSVKMESTMMVKATEMTMMVKVMMRAEIVIAEATVMPLMVMVKMTATAQVMYQLE
jgi:hypothetical protein